MGVKNRDFRSPDPLDQPFDPGDHFDDPEDQANEKPDLLAQRLAAIDDPPAMPGEFDVRQVRKRLGLTQRHFAGLFGFPVATLRHWERGNRRPTGTALVLLHVIRENPRVVRRAVLKARREDPGSLPGVEPRKSWRAPPGFGPDDD